VLLLSSRILVSTAESVAVSLGLPLVFIGLFVVGVGTSLPELFFGIKAALKHKSQMVLGDIFGSVIFNAGLILGITALISPIVIESKLVVYSSSLFLLIALVVFTYFLRTQYRLSRLEGIILTGIFILFMFFEFSLKVV
jgi:cation:H+ antiporter